MLWEFEGQSKSASAQEPTYRNANCSFGPIKIGKRYVVCDCTLAFECRKLKPFQKIYTGVNHDVQ